MLDADVASLLSAVDFERYTPAMRMAERGSGAAGALKGTLRKMERGFRLVNDYSP